MRATYAYKEVAGVCLEFDVIGAQPGEGQPCVMWIHGGGLIFGSRKASPRPPFLRALLERDVVVVSIDHRLAPETKLPGIVEDVRDAWHWLHEFGRRRLGVDPSRIAIAGASSGAYLAIMAGYALEEAPRAIASFWGFGDITAPWEAEPSAHYRQMALVTREEAEASLCAAPDADVGMDRSAFYLHCRQQGAWLVEVTGHDPREKPEWFDRYCPIRNINPRFPSTMLVHGVADNDVPHEQSAQLAARFAQAGIDHRFISLDGIGHGFANATPEQAEAVEREVADFLLARLT